MSEDLHSPTNAAPSPEPTPSVSPSDATAGRPAGTASPQSSPADRPEVLVGAAFAGGIVAAMILKRLGR